MSYEGAACMAAAFRSIGVNAQPTPEDDIHSYELARRYLSGDECLPEAVTLGGFLKIAERPDYDPERTAFLLPTSNGPCRYGHYLPLAQKVFHQIRGEAVMFTAPTSNDGYGGIGDEAQTLVRTGWRALVAADLLRKMLLITRPFEIHSGMSDQAFNVSLEDICSVIALRNVSSRKKLLALADALKRSHDRFLSIPVDRYRFKLVIGIVGEIFCRHNHFSNNHLFRRIEKLGGIVWISDIAEWVLYTTDEEEMRLRRYGKQLSFQMLGCKLKQAVMRHDEHVLSSIFVESFAEYPEPKHVREILELARPYLPREGANGEMVMSMGKTLWYQQKGVAGVIDISPFTCMNGIITEAVYPRVSRDFRGFPIRVFYFDAQKNDLNNDLEIFMELAAHYAAHKKASSG